MTLMVMDGWLVKILILRFEELANKWSEGLTSGTLYEYCEVDDRLLHEIEMFRNTVLKFAGADDEAISAGFLRMTNAC